MDLAKFLADLAAKALGLSQPATVTAIEGAASSLANAAVAVFAAVQAARAEKAAVPAK
jgi:hypothetical protein